MENLACRMIDVVNFFAFQLIFDNYTGAGHSSTSPAASHSTKIPENASFDVSSCPNSTKKKVADLR
jgi:hypothetical protein